jgi:hypothetical protein
MKSIPWGVVVFVLVFFLCYWRIWKDAHAVLDEPYDPLPDDDGQWIPHEIKPEHPGPYRTRVYRKHHLESYSTVWNGRKWVFGAEECYFQDRDWRALPGSVTP